MLGSICSFVPFRSAGRERAGPVTAPERRRKSIPGLHSNPVSGEVNTTERTHLPTCLSGWARVEEIIEQTLNRRERHSRMRWDNDHFALSWTAAGEAEESAPLISSNCHMWMPLQPGLSSINRNKFCRNFKGSRLADFLPCRPSFPFPLYFLPFMKVASWFHRLMCCCQVCFALLRAVSSEEGLSRIGRRSAGGKPSGLPAGSSQVKHICCSN